MLQIGELSEKTGVSTQAIRYYERVDLLPEPERAANGYRIYDASDVKRLLFIKGARALDFSLDDIAGVLALRDRDVPPCEHVLEMMRMQITQVTERIRELERLRSELDELVVRGEELPEDVHMRACVCHLIQDRS